MVNLGTVKDGLSILFDYFGDIFWKARRFGCMKGAITSGLFKWQQAKKTSKKNIQIKKKHYGGAGVLGINFICVLD